MKCKNVARFKSWLRKTAKVSPALNLSAVLDDVVEQHSATGSCTYELASCETKSGRPETYDYTVKTIFYRDEQVIDDPGNNDFDYAEEFIVF